MSNWIIAEPVQRLVEAFERLPGIGPKTASRLAYYLLRAPDNLALDLADALHNLKENTVLCERCFNVTVTSPCPICSDPNRDQSTVCVVEEPLDVVALERTGVFHGLYHVLHGRISPLEGIGPEQLKIRELLVRLQNEPITEVLIATNPTLEGEATAMYIARQIRPLNLRITRLAQGLPVGGDLEYADLNTLSRALSGREEMQTGEG